MNRYFSPFSFPISQFLSSSPPSLSLTTWHSLSLSPCSVGLHLSQTAPHQSCLFHLSLISHTLCGASFCSLLFIHYSPASLCSISPTFIHFLLLLPVIFSPLSTFKPCFLCTLWVIPTCSTQMREDLKLKLEPPSLFEWICIKIRP